MTARDSGRPAEPVPLRRRLQRLRRRARWLRLWVGAIFTSLSLTLSTLYENLPTSWQYVALGALSLIGAVTVLLLEPPEALEANKPTAPREPRAAPGPATRMVPYPGARRPVGPGSRQPIGSGPRQPTGSRSGRPGTTVDGGPRPVDGWLGWLPNLTRYFRAPIGRWRVEAVPTLPARDDLFRGRDRELADLRTQHDLQRAARPEPPRRSWWRRRQRPQAQPATGPVVLRVHGMPGVGKSALVDALARELAAQYPDGQVYVSLGTGSAHRPPHEILQELLLALGWQVGEMPAQTEARAVVFRSLTARKRMLFILDAARSAEQVRLVMPNSPTTAVLITSRRDLRWPDHLPTPSYHLPPLDADDALEMFAAVSGVPDGVRPECVAEIVDYCAGLPLAIRAAAERVAEDRADACQVAGLLREERSRLGWLVRPGRPLRRHLRTEYERLLPQEQTALALLSLIPSATFVPWVLTPMMELPSGEADALVDRLASAQLLQDQGMDDTSRVARYGLHPLVRLFAAEQAARLPRTEVGAAFARLDEAYLEVVAAALDVLEVDFAAVDPPRWLSATSTLPKRIADSPQQWVRLEYPNLLRLVRAANIPDRICWRIGAWLDGCVPADVSTADTLDAYRIASQAAEREQEWLGLVDVLLAAGTFLVAVERYREAEETFDRATALCERLRRDDPGDNSPEARKATLRLATVRRKIGEAFVQAARYREAVKTLEDAHRHAVAVDEQGEQRLVRVLLGEVHHVDTPEAAKDELLDPRIPDATRYRILLALAEAARRRGDWNSADRYFGQTLQFVASDQRRKATVQYRMARSLLGRAVAEDGDGTTETWAAVRAVRRAAAAAVTFQRMGNPIGEVRAYCLLARAVLALDWWVEADRLAHVAAGRLDLLRVRGEPTAVLAALAARLDRVRGEIRLRAGDREAARHLLMTAVATFAEQEDWAALGDVLRTLEQDQVDGRGPVLTAGWALPAGLPRPELPFPYAAVPTARDPGAVPGRLREEIRQALTPAPAVAFRGAVGVQLSGPATGAVPGTEPVPVWRAPVGRRCDLTVVVATGQRPYALGEHPVLDPPSVWRPAAAAGTAAAEVPLTVLVDAPFVEVSRPELTVTCPASDAQVRHRTELVFPEPGEHEVRIVLLSSDRLVQSLPIQIEAVPDDVPARLVPSGGPDHGGDG
ncbi:tetratricopeptide repeat protein [Plantactinospora sp. B24E8]|uniref:tetratricopeptide repeat protein n=1 Tax=Plantactinospora sp. B24E8 TaxID=3153567 RepID=UPI00325E97BF